MTTVELLRNNNVYRAIGQWVYMPDVARTPTSATETKVTPRAIRVCIVRAAPPGELTYKFVACASGTGREYRLDCDEVFEARDEAVAAAREQCHEFHGKRIGNIEYYYAPRRRKQTFKPEFRVLERFCNVCNVEYRDPSTRRWKPVIGLCQLTRWKAKDCVKRLVAGDEIPGYWQVPGAMEFIELADNVE